MIDLLPPEICGRARLDVVFFIDLPNAEEREAIWESTCGATARRRGSSRPPSSPG